MTWNILSVLSFPVDACTNAIWNHSTRVSGSIVTTKSASVETSSSSGTTSFFFLGSLRDVTSANRRRSSFLFGSKRAFFLLLFTHDIQRRRQGHITQPILRDKTRGGQK